MQVKEDIHRTLVFIDDFKHLKGFGMNVNAELFGITSNDDLRRRVIGPWQFIVVEVTSGYRSNGG